MALGPLNHPCEIRIGDWALMLSGCEVSDIPEPGGADDFLTSVHASPSEAAPASATIAANLPVAKFTATRAIPQPLAEITRAFGTLLAARKDFIEKVLACIESADPSSRANVVAAIVQICPLIEQDLSLRAIVEKQSGVPLRHTVESSSALAITELAKWYVSHQRQPNTAEEVFAFARKLKAGIDELLLGLIPLFAGLDRFEEQMALQPNADEAPCSMRFPRTPREAAARLFDWRTASDAAVRAMRTDLVDLTMHQVAILNGVMRGVKVLLEELAPDAIEQAWKNQQAQQGLLGRVFSKLGAQKSMWALYRERHGDFADEENERFRVVFGREFAEEYRHSGEPPKAAATNVQSPNVQGPNVQGPIVSPGTWTKSNGTRVLAQPPQISPPPPQGPNQQGSNQRPVQRPSNPMPQGGYPQQPPPPMVRTSPGAGQPQTSGQAKAPGPAPQPLPNPSYSPPPPYRSNRN
ncbi:MAG: hypothetical protein FWD69_13965 [Polyangiaceae bacterium]|nr:hypothetical protein [Polyangiaceae bacterium]